jgi:uncharacterized protein (TIGR00369 family)
MTVPDDAVAPLARPPGSTIDLALVRAVATETNRAQRSMGTRLVAIGRHSATIALPWRDDLADETGSMATGVLHALLDHACSLAALLSLDDPARFGTTMSLRVDHLEPPQPRRAVHAHADVVHEGLHVLSVRGAAFHADDARHPLAAATCTVAIAR